MGPLTAPVATSVRTTEILEGGIYSGREIWMKLLVVSNLERGFYSFYHTKKSQCSTNAMPVPICLF